MRHDRDILVNRKPIIDIADPVMRFHHVITIPRLQYFQRRRLTSQTWAQTRATFSSQILGPHFEHLSREWTITSLYARSGIEAGWTGTTTVAAANTARTTKLMLCHCLRALHRGHLTRALSSWVTPSRPTSPVTCGTCAA